MRPSYQLTASSSCALRGSHCPPLLPRHWSTPNHLAAVSNNHPRLLQLLLELPWPPCTTNSTNNSLDASQAHPSTSAHPSTQHAEAHAAAAVSCSLGLLQHLVSTYPAAARMCATALTRSEQLGQVLCAGLGCPLEAVVTPLLRCVSVDV